MKQLALALLLLVGACVRQVELTPTPPDAQDDDAAIGIPPDAQIFGVDGFPIDGGPDACPCTPDAL